MLRTYLACPHLILITIKIEIIACRGLIKEKVITLRGTNTISFVRWLLDKAVWRRRSLITCDHPEASRQFHPTEKWLRELPPSLPQREKD
jgi:hypothetical protein